MSQARGDKSDYINHIGAAFTTGAIFKSTAGIRPAFIMGTLLSSIVGSYGAYEYFQKNGLVLPKLLSKYTEQSHVSSSGSAKAQAS